MLEAYNFSMIDSEQLIPFGADIIGIFDDFDYQNDKYALGPFVKRAIKAHDNYGKAYERDLINPFTQKLMGKHEKRKNSFNGFKSYVVSCTFDDDAAISAAAKRLRRIIAKHGWRASSLGYLDHSSAINRMTKEINDLYLPDVALIGATNWFNKLIAAQEGFEAESKAKSTQPPSTLPTLGDTRPELEKALRKLFTMVDNHYEENTSDTVLAGYLSSINEYISAIMSIARAAETREENEAANSKPQP